MTKYVGQAAFISGGSSSVGQYGARPPRPRNNEPADLLIFDAAIQMAKLQGFSPIITTSSLKHEEWLKSLGATHVLDRRLAPEAILAELQKITGGAPIEYVYDAISLPDTEPLAYDALAPGGALTVVNDHMPNGLRAHFEERRPGAYGWNVLEAGPVVFRVEILRLA